MPAPKKQSDGEDTYLQAASDRIGLRIADSDRAAVSEDLKRIAGIAEVLMQFPLDQDMQAAPVFVP
jgi:hypothetical protein